MQTFGERLERVSGTLTPAVITTFMVLLASVPLRIPGAAVLMPSLALINIYYWGVFYPGTLPYWFLFALGLLEDTLAGTPLGVSSFINMGFAFLLVRERRSFGQVLFTSVWLGFIALSLAAVFTEWVILSIYWGRLLGLGLHLLQWAATCLSYPLMHIVLTRLYRLLVRA